MKKYFYIYTLVLSIGTFAQPANATVYKCWTGETTNDLMSCPLILDSDNAITCQVITKAISLDKNQKPVEKKIENSITPLNCSHSDHNWSKSFYLDGQDDFVLQVHYSYKTKLGALVKDASDHMNASDLYKGFHNTGLYRLLEYNGNTDIKINYVLISKKQVLKLASPTNSKVTSCSYKTCEKKNTSFEEFKKFLPSSDRTKQPTNHAQ